MKKWLLALLLLIVLGVGGFAIWRTEQLPEPQKTLPGATLISVDHAAVAERLAGALRYVTVAQPGDVAVDAAAFDGFQDYLRTRFPRVYQRLEIETVSGHSLLFKWTGTQPALPPALLAAHLDVVPADAAGWTHPPFDGVIADGYIWGRGALDDKNSVLAILEASESLLESGYAPTRTLMFAFGQDEEIGGERGAQAIAALLQRRGVKLAYTLDEGGAVTSGLMPGITRPVATVMAGEKGYLSLRLKLTAEGGHSSTPPPHTVIGRLAQAVARLEDHPLPTRLIAPVDAMLVSLAPDMDWPTRVIVANRDWLQALLLMALERSPTTNALIRTNTAPTMFTAGVRDNVLPASGEAVVNFRLLPGDTIASVITHVRKVIADDSIAVEPLPGLAHEAPPASNPKTPAFKRIEQAINDVFPEALVASGIVLGATDNRHYAAVREQGYYFSPMPYTPDDAHRIHGIDERIAVKDYVRMIQFYAQFLRQAAGP